MVDVLLIQPPIRDFYLTTKRTVPYGLACIAGALEADGFTVDLVDALASSKSKRIALPQSLHHLQEYYGRPDCSPLGLFHQFRHYGNGYDHLASHARESGAFLIGISSLFTAYAEEAVDTARAVRSACPDAYIVLGGHHPTEMPETVLAHPEIDAVLRGEGEVGIPALARALREGKDLAGVPGIARRRTAGGIRVSPPAVMASPDRYPLPPVRFLQHRRYTRRGMGSITLATSRGCPMGCSYCSTGRHSYMPYRRRAVGRILEEIRRHAEAGPVGFIDFEDEHLTADRDRFVDLLEGLRTMFPDAAPELRAMNGLFPPSLDDSLIRMMRAAGFRTLNLSLGSSSPAQLKRFDRPDVRKAFNRALESAARHGLKAVSYIIVGAPDQTAASALDDLLYLADRRVLAGLSVFYPAPGSRDYDRCREQGLLPASLGAYRATALPIDDTTSRVEIVTLLRLGRLVNFMKGILDAGERIPAPAAVGDHLDTGGRRHHMGRLLLQGFLYDGHIRGVTPTGDVYRHPVSTPLVQRFRDRLHLDRIRGTI